MKKILILLLFISSFLLSSNLKTEEKIYGLIIHALIPQETKIRVWGDTPHNQEVLSTLPDVILVNSPKNAEFILLSKEDVTNTKGLIFVTDYQLLEKMQNKALGGFFWQKGRPNILFLRQNLKKHTIKLPKSMQEFVEDEL